MKQCNSSLPTATTLVRVSGLIHFCLWVDSYLIYTAHYGFSPALIHLLYLCKQLRTSKASILLLRWGDQVLEAPPNASSGLEITVSSIWAHIITPYIWNQLVAPNCECYIDRPQIMWTYDYWDGTAMMFPGAHQLMLFSSVPKNTLLCISTFVDCQIAK